MDAAVALPYSEAEAFEVQFKQVNDVVYLVHPSHEPKRLVRRSDTDWALEEVSWAWPPLGSENVTETTLTIALEYYSDPLGNLYESPIGENYAPAA